VTLNLNFDPAQYPDRDVAIRAFRGPLKAMVARGEWRWGNPEHLVFLLGELAKNTFDHSEGIGILDVGVLDPDSISYLDTGKPFDWTYWSQPGLSSKPESGVNAGLGLTYLLDEEAKTGMALRIRRTDAGTEFKFVAIRR